MIVQPGPVVDFLIANQNARDPFSLDWAKVINVMHLIIIIIIIIICKILLLVFNIFFILPTGQENAKKSEGEDKPLKHRVQNNWTE